MKFKDYTWDKEFEIKGYFSEIPEDIVNEHDSLSGILHYSPSEIVLELFGAFEVESGISFGFGKYLEKIYGYSSDGKIIILNTYGEPTGTSSSPGFPITKYHVKNFKIYNVYYSAIENFNYSSESFKNLFDKLESEKSVEYKFSFEHIEEWVDKSLVDIKRTADQTIFESAVNKYQSKKVLINALGITLEDTAILNTSYTTPSFKSDYFIKLKSEKLEAINFDEFYKTSVKFKEFIEILSNIPLSFTDIEFLVDYKIIEEKRLPLIRGKYFVQHARKYKAWNKFTHQEISLRKIESNFDNILNHWFDKSEELEFIVREFSKNLHGDLYLEDQLVDAIRNLEVYSRNFMDFNKSENLSDDEQKARNALLDFIQTSILQEFRQKFRNKLKFKEKSPVLTERLRNLFDSIDESNKVKLFSKCSDRELLIRKLVQTRNYHTHGDSKDKYPSMISDFNEMYETKLLLQEILRFYIYKELDMKYVYENS
jgi:hypothetical protein